MARPTLPPPKLYTMSGPLGANGDGYKIELCGPTISSASFRQLIRVLEMTANWLEEDEREGNVDPIAERIEAIRADHEAPGGEPP